MNYPALLTRHESARRVGLSLRALDNLLATGQLPFYKLGKSVRLDPDDLDSFLIKHKVNARKEPSR